jgi:hypothetical protein
MTAPALDLALARRDAVAAPAPRASAVPLAVALFIESAVALAFAVALAGVAAPMDEQAAVGIRMAAGLSMVAAIMAWALGRRGVLRGRNGSYTAVALLQVALTAGIAAMGLAVAEPLLLAMLLPAPLLTMLALSLSSVREALGQS